MGILDGIVDWLATQVMNLLDLASTSVLGAFGCNMDTFKRYFPAASAMYEIFIWTAIGLVLLNLVWQLYRCYGAGFDIDTENPINLVVRSMIFLLLIWYCDDIVNLALQIGGTPYNWILDSSLPGVQFGDFNSVLLVIIGVIANGSVALIALILVVILAWNYLKLLFGSCRAICCAWNSSLYCAACLCHGCGARHKQHFQKLVPDVRRAASAADYERMVLEAVHQYGRGISRQSSVLIGDFLREKNSFFFIHRC
mgnify:CR=1 FL=1